MCIDSFLTWDFSHGQYLGNGGLDKWRWVLVIRTELWIYLDLEGGAGKRNLKTSLTIWINQKI